jgi:CRISPR-associated protein Csy1
METDNRHNERVAQLREAIEGFILQECLQPKLDKLEKGEEDKRQKLVDAHVPETWIANAAYRVGWIQQVTHALKYIHPDAKGTNISTPGNLEAGEMLVGTHTCHDRCPPDVVGNAAALDVYKFLRLEVNGKNLLAHAVEKDSALQEAFTKNSELGKAWIKSFAALTESKGNPASHKLAKQLYWPLENGNYHLLAPLFPTSLVHHVHGIIQEDRFSEQADAARKAEKNNESHPHGYREYLNMVVQKFGGANKQNISQFNSERNGGVHLLPSIPPNWKSEAIKPPLRVESVFDGWFGRRSRVKELMRILREFLYRVQDVNNMHVRNKRIELVGYIVEELLSFAAELRNIEESWTLQKECKLNINEQCWFNPCRAKTDPEFLAVYTRGDWKEAVCKRFANWLNAGLRDTKSPLPFGDAAASHWESDLDKALHNMLRLEVASYE